MTLHFKSCINSPLVIGLGVLAIALPGFCTVVAANENGSGNSDHFCQKYAEKAAERPGTAAGGAALGAVNGAAIGLVLGGSEAAADAAMLGLVAGGYKRAQERRQSYDRAYAECRSGLTEKK